MCGACKFCTEKKMLFEQSAYGGSRIGWKYWWSALLNKVQLTLFSSKITLLPVWRHKSRKNSENLYQKQKNKSENTNLPLQILRNKSFFSVNCQNQQLTDGTPLYQMSCDSTTWWIIFSWVEFQHQKCGSLNCHVGNVHQCFRFRASFGE